MKLMMNKDVKILKSNFYNYLFNKNNGTFIRWGRNKNDDPEFSPFGPEILDIEVSNICSKACSWCYKSNTAKGTYMTFTTFKKMFDKFPKMLTQIAFGIGDIDGNPDLYKIMKYCRDNKVIPNITINGERMTDYHYDKLVELCGAVAVSHYDDKTCFNAVQELTKRGLKQVNIHKLLANETYEDCFKLIDKTKTDERLKSLNAIVFLWLKPKGLRNHFTQLSSLKQYKKLVDYAFDENARIGFDSCSAANFIKVIKDKDNFAEIEPMVEPCESSAFSFYINSDGIGFPCSFTEGEQYKGIDTVNCKNFIEDVWFGKEVTVFRDKLLSNKDCNGCRKCQAFDLELEEIK